MNGRTAALCAVVGFALGCVLGYFVVDECGKLFPYRQHDRDPWDWECH